MNQYPKELKESIIARMLPPNNVGVPELTHETGIPRDTLYTWRRKSRTGIEYLFLNANGDPITRFGIRYITGKYGAAAQDQCPSIKTKNVNPHTIRHTTAMHLLRAGNDINMVSYWLGHADINTTHIYLEIDMEMKRRMLEHSPSKRKNSGINRTYCNGWTI